MKESTAVRLDEELTKAQSLGRMPSVVAGLIRGGGLVWTGAVGGVADDPAPGVDVQYRIGSITKTFVAVLVMRLSQEGLIALDDPVERWIPDTPFGDRTVRQLLTHTGGLSAEPPGSWWERSAGVSGDRMREIWSPEQVVDEAGRRHHYSNLGFAVLGELVQRLRDAPWFEVLSAEVLQPLGMTRTTLTPQPEAATGWAVHPYAEVIMPEQVQETGWMAPAGQLWSTVTDLARWARFIAGDTGDVLPASVVARMREPQAVTDGDEWTSGQGLGLQLIRHAGTRFAGHGGSMPGFQAGLLVDPVTGTGVVRLTNCTTVSPGAAGSLRLWEVLRECEPPPPAVWSPVPAVDADALALTGQWFWGTSVGVMRVDADGHLVLDSVSGMMPTSRFTRIDGDRWRGDGAYFTGEVLRVERDDRGRVTCLNIATFVLTRAPYQPGDVIPGGLERGWPTR